MSKELVLVDTSIWLAVSQPRHAPLKVEVATLQAANRIAVNWLIKTELLTGAKDEHDFRQLEDALNGLHQLALHEGIWRETASLRFQLRNKGVLLPLVDAAIASCAMVYECALLHLDRHFDMIARHAPLKVFKPKHVKVS